MSPIILAIDDNPDIRDMLGIGLSARGFNVRLSDSREKAVPMLTDDLDAILLDYKMPGMTAEEFIKIVRGKYPNLCVILFSGSGGMPEQVRALGLTFWVPKPFEFDRLLSTLRDC